MTTTPGEVTARLPLASALDVEAAEAAFPLWRDTSLARRAQIVFRFRELPKPATTRSA